MNRLEKAFSQIYGEPCWNVRKGVGSFLTLEFGEPKLSIHEPTSTRKRRLVNVRGAWHFWVYCCNWKYFDNDQLLGHNESLTKEIEKIARNLDGQAIQKATVTTEETVLEFDLGGRLVLIPNKTDYDDKEKTEQWMLFMPNGEVCTLRADGQYSCNLAGDHLLKNWLPI